MTFSQGQEASTIVEMKNDLIAQKGVCMANSTYLREFFASIRFRSISRPKSKRLTDEGHHRHRAKMAKTSILRCRFGDYVGGLYPNPGLAPEEKNTSTSSAIASKVGNLTQP
jgi:2-enoate reductase